MKVYSVITQKIMILNKNLSKDKSRLKSVETKLLSNSKDILVLVVWRNIFIRGDLYLFAVREKTNSQTEMNTTP